MTHEPSDDVKFQLDPTGACWDDYVLTEADIKALLDGADPATIGPSGSYRKVYLFDAPPVVEAGRIAPVVNAGPDR